LDPVRLRVRAEPGSLQPGSHIEIEIGARWNVGENERVGGVWVSCEVVNDSVKELVVRLLT
jgi:hypothetical protein